MPSRNKGTAKMVLVAKLRWRGALSGNSACASAEARSARASTSPASTARPATSPQTTRQAFASARSTPLAHGRPRDRGSRPLTRICASRDAVAEPSGALCNAVQHGLDIGGRAADDAEDLGRGRLLLERFGQFAVARLQLVEHPHVLDRDRRLVGEGLDQFDLLRGERPHLGAVDRQGSDRHPVANERRGEARPDPLAFDRLLDVRILARQVERQEVVEVQRSAGRSWPGRSTTRG